MIYLSQIAVLIVCPLSDAPSCTPSNFGQNTLDVQKASSWTWACRQPCLTGTAFWSIAGWWFQNLVKSSMEHISHICKHQPIFCDLLACLYRFKTTPSCSWSRIHCQNWCRSGCLHRTRAGYTGQREHGLLQICDLALHSRATPPEPRSPQVTTDPSARSEAKATSVASTCCIFWRPHLTTDIHRPIFQDCSNRTICSLNLMHVLKQLSLDLIAVPTEVWVSPCNNRSIRQDCSKSGPRRLDLLHVP